MSKTAWGVALVLAGMLAGQPRPLGSGRAEDGPAARPCGYIGASSCKACHARPAGGEAYVKWEQSAHARAYRTLLGEPARAAAARVGLSAAPAESDQCLICHVTGHGAPAERLGKKYDSGEGVGCESCHGPAAEWKVSHARDREAALSRCMIVPDEALCRTCHNERCPVSSSWSYEEGLARIAHPNPERGKRSAGP